MHFPLVHIHAYRRLTLQVQGVSPIDAHEFRVFFHLREMLVNRILLPDTAGHVDFLEQLPPDGALLQEMEAVGCPGRDVDDVPRRGDKPLAPHKAFHAARGNLKGLVPFPVLMIGHCGILVVNGVAHLVLLVRAPGQDEVIHHLCALVPVPDPVLWVVHFYQIFLVHKIPLFSPHRNAASPTAPSAGCAPAAFPS